MCAGVLKKRNNQREKREGKYGKKKVQHQSCPRKSKMKQKSVAISSIKKALAVLAVLAVLPDLPVLDVYSAIRAILHRF